MKVQTYQYLWIWVASLNTCSILQITHLSLSLAPFLGVLGTKWDEEHLSCTCWTHESAIPQSQVSGMGEGGGSWGSRVACLLVHSPSSPSILTVGRGAWPGQWGDCHRVGRLNYGHPVHPARRQHASLLCLGDGCQSRLLVCGRF